jgi:hypothetical protein
MSNELINTDCEHKNKKQKTIVFPESIIDLTNDTFDIDDEEIGSEASEDEYRYTEAELEDFEIQRKQAIWDRSTTYENWIIESERNDRIERRDNQSSSLSDYELEVKFFNSIGDIGADRYWFYASYYGIDDLFDKEFSNPNLNIDWEYYCRGKETYKAISRNLTPLCTKRQIGRVFFSTVTRYIEKGIPTLQDKKQVIRNYIVRDGRKVYGDSYNKPGKGTNYIVRGNGILKYNFIEEESLSVKIYNYNRFKPTFSGEIKETPIEDQVLQELNAISGNRETFELSDEYFDIHQHLCLYHSWSTKLDRDIDKQILNKIKAKIAVRIISRAWSKRLSIANKATCVIQRFLGNCLTRSIGKTKTFL